MQQRFMVFDVESVGLHGEAFAVGAVVIDDGKVVDEFRLWSPPDLARGTAADHDWVRDHCAAPDSDRDRAATAMMVRALFWSRWLIERGRGAMLAADCPWPVESRFLTQCVEADPTSRAWNGPYPLIDVASVRLAAGLDPIGTEERRDNELPVHDPLADARQSARLLCEALDLIKAGKCQ